jgi:hypothetical protein
MLWLAGLEAARGFHMRVSPSTGFEELGQAWVICRAGDPLPGIGRLPFGTVVEVFPNQAAARRRIKDLAASDPGLFDGLTVERVGDPLQFMKRVAQHGVCSLQPAAESTAQSGPKLWAFMTRVEEAGRDAPTVLTVITPDGLGPSLTLGGVRELGHGELLHWERFDILDAACADFVQESPFRGWQNGEPFFEIRAPQVEIAIDDVPILGHWLASDGAYPLFSSHEAAAHFLANGLRGARLISIRLLEGANVRELATELRVEPVTDLATRLGESAEADPFIDVVINPTGHRANAAWTTPRRAPLVYSNGRWVDLTHADPAPWLRAVSGLWRVRPNNVLELHDPAAWWNGADTVFWAGGPSFQLERLGWSLHVPSGDPALPFDPSSLSATETKEALGTWLTATPKPSARRVPRLEAFHLLGWTLPEGELVDEVFPSALDAVRFLYAESVRQGRYFGRHGNEDATLRAQRLQHALQEFAAAFVTRGYRGGDGHALVTICNATLAALHIDALGYAKDLLWASSDAELDRLLSRLRIPTRTWDRWRASAVELPVSPVGAQLAIERLRADVWGRLANQTKSFIATALEDWAKREAAPLLDYAPITVEISKGVEVELVRLVAPFRVALNGAVPVWDPQDKTAAALAGYLAGKPLTLGSFLYLFNWRPGQSSPLHTAWADYLETLPQRAYLSGPLRKQLPRIVHRYRNGGAHDSRIELGTCRDCIEEVLGSSVQPGVLAHLVAPG